MKVQIRFQKVICMVMLITSAIFFVFALGLLTDMYHVYSATEIGVRMYRDIFTEMQPLNKTIVSMSIVSIVLSALFFLTHTNKRRNYYISNYINIVLLSGANVFFGIYSIINILKYKNIYFNEVLTDQVKEKWISKMEIYGDVLKFIDKTVWLDINIITSALIIIASLLLISNLIWKIILMKEEKSFLSSQYKLMNKEEVLQ